MAAAAKAAAPAAPRARTSTPAQILRNPGALTVYNPSTAGVQVSAVGKVAAVFVLLMIGLDLYGKATHQNFTLDLLNPVQLFGGNDQSPVLPSASSGATAVGQGFNPAPPPPTATSPGGGGHSNQS